MITITMKQGVLHVPVPPADDAMTIQGRCQHGVSLFRECPTCYVEQPWVTELIQCTTEPRPRDFRAEYADWMELSMRRIGR